MRTGDGPGSCIGRVPKIGCALLVALGAGRYWWRSVLVAGVWAFNHPVYGEIQRLIRRRGSAQ